MNRLVNGLGGFEASEEYMKMAGKRLADAGYVQLLKLLPAETQERRNSRSTGDSNRWGS